MPAAITRRAAHGEPVRTCGRQLGDLRHPQRTSQRDAHAGRATLFAPPADEGGRRPIEQRGPVLSQAGRFLAMCVDQDDAAPVGGELYHLFNGRRAGALPIGISDGDHLGTQAPSR